MQKNVLLEQKGHLALVTLNREEAMNAFNYDSLRELAEIVESLRINPEVRAVIFKGSGNKAFSVGADLKERKTLTEQQVKRNVFKIGEVFAAVEQLPQPTVAAMNGYAFGGGMELALACDFRIAVEDTKMGLTETSLAIIPGAGGTQRLPRLIGESKAMELILTAKRLSSEEALEYGLLTRVVSRVMFDTEVEAFAHLIMANGPIAVRQAKFAIKNGMNADLHTGLQIERKAYEITIPTEDRVEALIAFGEKRKPEFKGK
ncbi:enoyl-CoA hydratase-related protein [Bacillus sp. 2205SS5-2]|uniref:enoyl-CoA hydratase-related protein n=1 Tax=Bacillus sp. 2205SS5-2 TaxID=3109031 RepID=UPI0030075896